MLKRCILSTTRPAAAAAAVGIASMKNLYSTAATSTTCNSPKLQVALILQEEKERQKLKELEKKLHKEHSLKVKQQKQKSKQALLNLIKQQKEKPLRKKKDPNAPKRALTPLLWFTTRNFALIQAELVSSGVIKPETVQKLIVVQSELKKRWDSLAENEKAIYVALASEDKVRYQKEMKAFNKKKEANKRPMTCYLRFFMEIRPQLVAENQGVSVTDIAKKASQLWKELSADKKRVYQEAFEADMEMYRSRQ